jgi:hypothetical protein
MHSGCYRRAVQLLRLAGSSHRAHSTRSIRAISSSSFISFSIYYGLRFFECKEEVLNSSQSAALHANELIDFFLFSVRTERCGEQHIQAC